MKISQAINVVKRVSKKDSIDFFETQSETIDILYDNYLNNILENHDIICDFSCGNYTLLDRIKYRSDKFLNTYGSDLYNRNNDTRIEINSMFNISNIIEGLKNIHIIMNPPFNLLAETFEYYLKLKKKYPQIKTISLLYSLRSLEGQRRNDILNKYGYPSLILNIVKRSSFNTYFKDNNLEIWTPPFSCIWSIWDNNYRGYTKFLYI